MELRVSVSGAEQVGPAVDEAMEGLGLGPGRNGRSAFVLALTTYQYDPDELAGCLQAALVGVRWAGCACAGLIHGRQMLKRGVLLISFEGAGVQAGVGAAGPVSGGAREAGRRAASQALAQVPALTRGRHQALLVFTDTLDGAASEVVRGAAQTAGGRAWGGGGTGDGVEFCRTSQLVGGQARADQVLVVALDLPVPAASAVRHGWQPDGPFTLVTRATGPLVEELDYRSAFTVYQASARARGEAVEPGSFAQFAVMHPLGVPQWVGEHLICDPVALEARGALRCLAQVPEGALVSVMASNPSALVRAAGEAASDARVAAGGGGLSGALVFDCFTRCAALGSDVGPDLEAIHQAMGPDVPVAGCLTLGEVGGVGTGLPRFYNKSVVVMALGAEPTVGAP